MRYTPGNAQDIGCREDQQDSFGFSRLDESSFTAHGGFVAVIADGMGGLAHGKEASQAAAQTFLRSYAAKQETEEIPEALRSALENANRAVLEAGRQAGSPGDVGSTLVAAALWQSSLYWVSVGDSALYLLRDGRLTLLTDAHTYAREIDRQVAGEFMPREQVIEHPDRDALTSYLGQQPIRKIDGNRKPFLLRAGDQVILCTDGLFKTLGEEAMAQAMTEAITETMTKTMAKTMTGAAGEAADPRPQRCCELLAKRALERREPYQDNLTVLAVGVEAEPEEAKEVSIPPTLQPLSRSSLQPGLRFYRSVLTGVCGALIAIAVLAALFWHFNLAARFRRSTPPSSAAQPAPSIPSMPSGTLSPLPGKLPQDGKASVDSPSPSVTQSSQKNPGQAPKNTPKD